jgi:hypothetical protein
MPNKRKCVHLPGLWMAQSRMVLLLSGISPACRPLAHLMCSKCGLGGVQHRLMQSWRAMGMLDSVGVGGLVCSSPGVALRSRYP